MAVTTRLLVLIATALLIAVPALAGGKTKQEKQDSDRAARWDRMVEKRDGDKDGRISAAEWLDKNKAFEKLDANHDGVVAGDEVTDDKDKLKRLIEHADADKNGKVTLDEWKAFRQAAFKKRDPDGDGFLTRSEYLKYDADGNE